MHRGRMKTEMGKMPTDWRRFIAASLTSSKQCRPCTSHRTLHVTTIYQRQRRKFALQNVMHFRVYENQFHNSVHMGENYLFKHALQNIAGYCVVVVAVHSFLTVLCHPFCGLCRRQAVVFFQYLVGHSGPI